MNARLQKYRAEWGLMTRPERTLCGAMAADFVLAFLFIGSGSIAGLFALSVILPLFLVKETRHSARLRQMYEHERDRELHRPRAANWRQN